MDEYGSRVNLRATAVAAAEALAAGDDPSRWVRDSGVGPGLWHDPAAGTVTVRGFPGHWPTDCLLDVQTVDGVDLVHVTVPIPSVAQGPALPDLSHLPHVSPHPTTEVTP